MEEVKEREKGKKEEVRQKWEIRQMLSDGREKFRLRCQKWA
jgi:hypothetical protein